MLVKPVHIQKQIRRGGTGWGVWNRGGGQAAERHGAREDKSHLKELGFKAKRDHKAFWKILVAEVISATGGIGSKKWYSAS